MSRNKVNEAFSVPFGHRLEALVCVHLQISWSELARKLKYSNSSTLFKIKNGKTLPSVDKLHELAAAEFDNYQINVNWLLTGKGTPLLPTQDTQTVEIVTDNNTPDEEILARTITRILRRYPHDTESAS
ncbi:MAG: helix-turn-helix transcriptional regulator [Candidatus Thiodiazotropha endolucinida]